MVGGCHHFSEGRISATILMDGICWKNKLRNLIDKHGGFAAKDIPISLIVPIACFIPANGHKFKRTMNKGTTMGKIDPTLYLH